jgi:hypothetical protein
MRILTITGILIFLTLVSCKKDKVIKSAFTGDCSDTVSFSAQVLPIIQQNCSTSGCHDSGSSAGGFNLSDFNSINSASSQVLAAMRHDGGFTAMPLGGDKLEDSLIQKVECWIAQGKLNN